MKCFNSAGDNTANGGLDSEEGSFKNVSSNGATKTFQLPGRRWVVLLACTLNFGIVVGTTRSIGVLYVDIMDAMAATRAEAASVVSLLIGISFCIGKYCNSILSIWPISKIGKFMEMAKHTQTIRKQNEEMLM